MNTLSIKRQAAASHLIHWMVTLGDGSGTDFEASGERHDVFQWIQSDPDADAAA